MIDFFEEDYESENIFTHSDVPSDYFTKKNLVCKICGESKEICPTEDSCSYKINKPEIETTKPKNNFKDYGFKEDEKIKIFSEFENELYGAVYIQTNSNVGNEEFTWQPEKWSIHGGESSNEGYNLVPIKKEWYEDESNFNKYKGKLIINKYGHIRKCDYVDKSKVSTREQNMYHDILSNEEWRPATKEEVLNLVVEE